MLTALNSLLVWGVSASKVARDYLLTHLLGFAIITHVIWVDSGGLSSSLVSGAMRSAYAAPSRVAQEEYFGADNLRLSCGSVQAFLGIVSGVCHREKDRNYVSPRCT